eukprot:scaffold91_cov254-Pinguiococcus_pyrenoidosus.AAC.3
MHSYLNASVSTPKMVSSWAWQSRTPLMIPPLLCRLFSLRGRNTSRQGSKFQHVRVVPLLFPHQALSLLLKRPCFLGREVACSSSSTSSSCSDENAVLTTVDLGVAWGRSNASACQACL